MNIKLTTLAGVIRKIAPFAVVILLATILIILIRLRYSPKEPPLTIQKPRLEALPGQVREFDLGQLNPPGRSPDKMPIYSLQAAKSLLDQTSSLATRLGFANSPQPIEDINLGKGLIYTDSNAALIVYREVLTYQRIKPPETSTKLSSQGLKTKAIEILNSLDQTLAQTEPQISYWQISGEDFAETSPGLAIFVEFTFPGQIAGFPVISAIATRKVTLDMAGNLSKLSQRNFQVGATLNEVKILSFQKALELLQRGNATIVAIKGTGDDTSQLQQLTRVSLTEAYLAYYLESQTSATIQPVWVFEGLGQVKNVLVTLTFAIPAIDPQFFNQP